MTDSASNLKTKNITNKIIILAIFTESILQVTILIHVLFIPIPRYHLLFYSIYSYHMLPFFCLGNYNFFPFFAAYIRHCRLLHSFNSILVRSLNLIAISSKCAYQKRRKKKKATNFVHFMLLKNLTSLLFNIHFTSDISQHFCTTMAKKKNKCQRLKMVRFCSG